MTKKSKLYTKTGDKGETGLIGGIRVKKDNLRVASYGDIDELNSTLGIIRTHADLEKNTELSTLIAKIQNQLFDIGAELATPPANKWKDMKLCSENEIEFLELTIDKTSDNLPPLKNFILPGGTLTNSYLHLARTVCRRAERQVVKLAETEVINSFILIYLNRLSDLCFILARKDSWDNAVKEYLWEKD